MPMMWLAPPSTAPRIAAAPTPPTPMTATESPGCMRATFSTAPTPVDTPHEINAAMSGSRSFGTTATFTAGVTVCALKLPSPRVVAMSVPSAPCMRKVWSANDPSACARVVQNVFCPRRQLSHLPHGPDEQVHDLVADRDAVDAGTDLLDDPRALVPAHRGDRAREVAVEHVEVGPAQAGGRHPDQDLAGSGLVELDGLDRKGLVELTHHCCCRLHGRNSKLGGCHWTRTHA